MHENWRDAYQAALQEKDRQKLGQLCDVAQRAIRRRYREVMMKPDEHVSERAALSSAMHIVKVIKRVVITKKKAASQGM
jgi:hypothetical protein